MNHPRYTFATLALVMGLWSAAFFSGCQDSQPSPSRAAKVTPTAQVPTSTSNEGAKATPTPPKTTPAKPKPKPEVSPEIMAKQDAIRTRLTELVDDPKTDAFEDTDTLVKEFPDVEFDILMAVEGSRSIRVKLKGGEEFYVLPRDKRTKP